MTLQWRAGETLQLAGATLRDARWPAGILAVNPRARMSDVDAPFGAGGAPEAVLAVIGMLVTGGFI